MRIQSNWKYIGTDQDDCEGEAYDIYQDNTGNRHYILLGKLTNDIEY